MKRRPRLLVVDDDREVLELVALALQPHFECRTVPNGERALEALWSFVPHALLLDLGLPGFQGDALIRLIRQDPKVQSLPILVLTADAREPVHLAAFAAGADDVLTKPFSPLELAARVRALLRRGAHPADAEDILEAGPVRLSLATHEVTAAGRPVELTPTEFSLLHLLLRAPGQVVSKESMIEFLWGNADEMRTRTIDTHIANLRKKLGKAAEHIETVREFGLRFAP